MREIIHKELKEYLCKYIKDTRKSMKLSQEKMAEKLIMDARSYADIENGSNMCGTITFIYFMLYMVEDIEAAFEGIAVVIENAKEHVA